jgi:hypothetical protein
VARNAVSKPPHEWPITPTFAGSITPIVATFFTPAVTHSTTDRPGSRGRKTISGWNTK